MHWVAATPEDFLPVHGPKTFLLPLQSALSRPRYFSNHHLWGLFLGSSVECLQVHMCSHKGRRHRMGRPTWPLIIFSHGLTSSLHHGDFFVVYRIFRVADVEQNLRFTETVLVVTTRCTGLKRRVPPLPYRWRLDHLLRYGSTTALLNHWINWNE